MREQSYTPTIWRQNPMHLSPPVPFDPTDPGVKRTLDWIFLISALNFSFWSELEGEPTRYGVTWRAGWDESLPEQKWEGYWSLVASLNRGPSIHSHSLISDSLCPNLSNVIQHSNGAPQSQILPSMPLRSSARTACWKKSFGL
jgi:hypothetical protein